MENTENASADSHARLTMPHVVLPVCDEQFGQKVIDTISKMPWEGKVSFHLVFVVDLDGLPKLMPDAVPQLEADERQYGHNLLEHLVKQIRTKLPQAQVVKHIVVGSPQSEILRLADDVSADMIVMGSHCRKGLKKFVLGSVALSVVQRAKCSTMVVNLPSAEEPVKFAGPEGMSMEDLPAKMTTYSK